MMAPDATAAARAERARARAKRALLPMLVIGCVALASHLLDDFDPRRGGGADVSRADGGRNFRRILAPAVDDDDLESAGAELPYALPREADCDEVVRSVLGDTSALDSDSRDGEVNALRRTLALGRPSCHDRHFHLFADRFSRRVETVRRHLTLNVPEAGGTALCRAARRSGLETFPRARECWESPFDPEWHHVRFKDPWTVLQDYGECAIADSRLPEFVVNENHLTLPLCTKQRIYSLTLRDVADRLTSQEGRMASLAEKRQAETTPDEHRLSLLRSNYVTWSLTASIYGGWPSPPPEERRLVDAKRALMKFDFLLEEPRDGAPDPGCGAAVLRLMGLDGTEIPPEGTMKAEAGTVPDRMKAAVSREDVDEKNGLDVKLIEFGRRLLDVDCAFFERVASMGSDSALTLLSK